MKRDCWEKEFPRLGEDDIKRFATAIGDHNPIHHSLAGAVTQGLLGIVAPGVMLIGYASSTIAEEFPCVLIREIQLKFKKPLYAGALPVVFCAMSRKRGLLMDVHIDIRNGAEILAHGSCTLLLAEQ